MMDKLKRLLELMPKRGKNFLAKISALLMVVSGIVLSFISLNEYSDVQPGVLAYVAQVLVYAGSVFGLAIKLGEGKEPLPPKDKDPLSPKGRGGSGN